MTKLFSALVALVSVFTFSACNGKNSSTGEAARAASLAMGPMISNSRTSAILDSLDLNSVSVNESIDIDKATVDCIIINTSPAYGKNYGDIEISGSASGSSVEDISVNLKMVFNKCIRTLSDSEFCGTGTGGDVTIDGNIESTAKASYNYGSTTVSEMTIKGEVSYSGIFTLQGCAFDVTLNSTQLKEIQTNRAIGASGFGGTICGQTWDNLKSLLTSSDHNLMCVIPKTGTASVD